MGERTRPDDRRPGDDDRSVDVEVPDSATPEEAAAIVAAIESYLAEEREASADRPPSWDGRRWTFAGRVESVSSRTVRIPEGAPTDAWTAAGRADRL